MNQVLYNQLFSFIWNIANDVLVHVFNKGGYKKVNVCQMHFMGPLLSIFLPLW